MAKNYAFYEPIKIGTLTLKNRIILSAMVKRIIVTQDGHVDDDYLAYYENYAKNGVALITPGIMPIDADWPYIAPGEARIWGDEYIPGLKRLVDAVHKHGTKITFQPWCSGNVYTDRTVNSYSLDQIHDLQEKWFQAARRTKEAGADGIEFHLAHTYLACEFLSPHFNKRTDEYGAQNIENATRFALEIINRIREELVDENFIITAKLNADEFFEDGITPEYAADIAVLLEKAGVCMINVNAGGVLSDITGMSDDGKRAEGWKIPLAEAVKSKVSIPIAGCGSIRHPEYADKILREGRCDLIAIGRGLLAEPEWLTKVQQGREDEMRYCISCMFCFGFSGPDVSICSVNPFAKRERFKPELKKDGNGRKVMVIGSGPSGLEAAVTLAERGFRPFVFDKNDYLGGQSALAAVPPDKHKIGWMLDYYRRQIKRLNIPVSLGREVTAEYVKMFAPYAVVMAAGSNEFVPPIQGIDGENVVNVRDILEGKRSFVNQNMVILGGGLTGLETARLLRHAGNEVTVLEMLPKDPAAIMEMRLALRYCAEDRIKVLHEHKVLSVAKDKVTAENLAKNKQEEFAADYVVVSLGIRPNDALYDAIKAVCPNTVKVGDCDKLGKISSAVQSGSTAGYSLA
ncbi:NAD(P)/FAD-dependent oxidoreductase [Clostridia bacterium OttesenSCG-928-F22]|nr:NAD(P)/FAD-dependent oxidoreductase [Clostridia bacterium OttesenSCG-928-F22]